MPARHRIEVQARVTTAIPNCMFWVELENGHKSLVGLSGKMKRNNIKVVEGNKVTVELSPYDLSRGRIISKE